MNPSRFILQIDGRQYALRRELSHSQIADLLVILDEAVSVEESWTPDYQQRRAVTASGVSIGVSIIPAAKVCTKEEWDELCAKHPRKEESR